MVHPTRLPARAIVARGPVSAGGWDLEAVRLREINEDELVVRMVASGICHTDVHFADREEGYGILYPCVKGHEGSGIVERIGSKVTAAQPGDPVLLSFSSCGECAICKLGHPAHCINFNDLNFLGGQDFFSGSEEDGKVEMEEGQQQPEIAGRFFGQSSFASVTVARESSIVNVKGLVRGEEELKLLAPLGCGIQTGVGTVVNVGGAGESDSVAVLGVGGVGLSAIMGAKIQNCKTIVGIDRFESRLQTAKELGATHTINTSGMQNLDDVVEAVRAVTEGLGTSITIDTTGFMPLVQKALEFTRFKGKLIQVGAAAMGAKLEVEAFPFMVAGKQYIGAVEGDVRPADFIPKMISWYREGRLPIDKLIKFFPAEEWGRALEEMHDGRTVKPVICW
ncbi:alcohol dehydrogenase [Saccharata proteae CBS 121410]|uniref:Alcohol dehydrogenase n=1 Tax=Saccharata proteae CBS 121410 TaxID=1314787 RepID=A0A9P4HX70_9PEZI|nr:alcohol dehydrogenase [Saccharata proteae CBS 121410]